MVPEVVAGGLDWWHALDVLFHLAAAVGVRLIVESPVSTIETKVHGTGMVLKRRERVRQCRQIVRVDAGRGRRERFCLTTRPLTLYPRPNL